MGYIRGIDVSSYDPYIDWQTVRNQDIRFAIIKSTEGIGYFSDHFNEQWAGAKSVGILRGSYHYLRAAQDGSKQADFFLSKVNVQDGDLPPFLDIEGANNDGATNSQFIGNAQKWLERVEEKTGRRPVVYSTAAFLREKLNGNNGKPPPWAQKYQTWVAQYFFSYSADAGGQPTQPTGWGDWIFWQYSGDHDSLDGIYQDAAKQKLVLVDLNVYRHSLDELYKLAKAQQPADADIASNAPVHTRPTVNPPVQAPPPVHAPVEMASPGNSQPVSSITYTVQSGDTLWAISNKFGVTVDAIVRLNKIANPDLINVGQVLQIPGK
jgi:GH25 family lysozyme M1 (1,4-beta-N-acetylmuramidase)